MINMVVRKFERDESFQPDFYAQHWETVEGETPEKCMRILNDLRMNNDLNIFTPYEIMGIYTGEVNK